MENIMQMLTRREDGKWVYDGYSSNENTGHNDNAYGFNSTIDVSDDDLPF